MATPRDYQVGTAALIPIVTAAIKANVPAFMQADVPQSLVAQIEAQGAKAVIDAVDKDRAAVEAAKGQA
jgi:hypothetical protein